MDISKILEEPLIVKYNDSVSKVASRMIRERKHEALVLKDKSFEGIILSNDIVKRNIPNPDKMKINLFIRNVETFYPDTSTEDAINEILINNFKSLPVKSADSKDLFIVTKIALMNNLKNEAIIKKRVAKEIMNFPFCIDRKDTIATAKSIVKDMDMSAIPIIDEENNTFGVIETVDLLKASIHSAEKSERGEEAGEKKSIKNVFASSIMQKNFPKASLDAPIKQLIDKLAKSKIHVVIIEEDGKFVGMVTPRDILKLFSPRKEGVYVTINGIQKEDDFIKSVIDEEITNEVKKLAKILPIQYFVINVKKHDEDGKRSKYSIKSRLITQKGAFFAHDFAWDITKAIRGMLHKLEREIVKKTRKEDVYTRAP